ncbi:hypothetical protein AC249_AIPGENE15220 [Exaiptasia diaphana]|nr:hypothetical protein AC249_AIPGENE15220 [Exaiptasia diaphana]
MVRKKNNPRYNVARMQKLVHGSPMKRNDREILKKSAIYSAKLAKLRRLEKKEMPLAKGTKATKTRLLSFTCSLDCMKVLYRGGLISKAKSKEIRSSSSLESKTCKKNKGRVKCMDGVPIPRILPYDKLISCISSLDIGTLFEISDYCYDLPDDEKVDRKYRDLEDLLLRIAKMYLYIEENFDCDEEPLLHWFGNERGTFKVALGADGAPFGKESEATARLISFINVTSHVYCCNDNFLFCGSNCKEDHTAMIRFANDLVSTISEIESKVYKDIVEGVDITFTFELIPSDMKWIAFFAGELNNAAHYFSTFANVNADNRDIVGGTLGNSPSDTWEPWDYDHRLQVANKINELTEKLKSQTITEDTKRKKS